MSADYQLSPRDYLAIARRWALAMGLTFGVVLLGSVVAALVQPRVYESSGTLLAEAPRVSSDVARSGPAVSAEQRARALERRLMTRESLLRIANQHDVFGTRAGSSMKDTDIVTAMRASIGVNVVGGGSSGWGQSNNNVALVVSFQHGKPEKAFEVSKALVQLFLESSVQERVAQASQANEFLSQEANRVKAQLEELERQIASYKRAQGGALAGEGQVVALSNIQSMESDLRAAEREHRAALNELKTLEVELAGARSGVMMPGAVAATGPSAAEQELERARTELATLRGIYTDDHPDVRAQQRRIDTLERALRAEAGRSTPAREAAAGQARLAVSRLEAQIATARARADLLADQQRELRASIAQQRSQVSRGPQIERDLAALERDQAAVKSRYDDLRARQMAAQTVQNLEGEQQGERFTLLEPPLLPEYPIKPKRKKILAAGFVLALAAAVGIAVLLETLFGRIRGTNALTALMGRKPMVVIPYIVTTSEAQSIRDLRRRLLLLAAGAGLVALALIHALVMPLHTLLISMLARLG